MRRREDFGDVLVEDDEPLAHGDSSSHPGFQFGGSELTVPSGGFSFY